MNNGWLPIESAPKTGERIVLFIDDSVIEGWWDDERDIRGEKYGDGLWQVVGLNSHGCGCCADENPEPTHWQPLFKPNS